MKQVIIKALKGEPEKSKIINLKVSTSEHELLKARAFRYANGNLSAWIRYASINLDPKPDDLADV